MSAVLAWIKSNLASVIFIVVMVVALVSLPILAGRLNRSIQDQMKDRVGQHRDLVKLEKTDVKIGNPVSGHQISETALVNKRLLDRLLEVTEAETADATRVQEAAELHNRKGRGVLLDRLFPEPPPAEREVLPEAFHHRLDSAYEQLLERVGAGSPPSLEVMRDEILRREDNFRNQTLQKDVGDPLDEEEQRQLQEALTEQRMSLYAEQAERIGLYATIEALNVPRWEQARQPSLSELYDWQWQYWVVEDLLEALAEANRGSATARYSVQQAPAKRVLDVVVYESDPGEGGGGGPGASRGDRGRGSDGPTGIKPNPAAEVTRDYGVSFTGRVTNPLYDVRLAEMTLVIETARLPAVMNALARRNFITVLDVDVVPADHYAAARDGYFYGSEPVSEVTLTLETIWLRSWTTPYMPGELKQALHIPVDPPAG